MKIVTPLNNEEWYEALIKAGADEFYCGYQPPEWLKRYSNIYPINRREFLANVNICDLNSMKILGKMVDKYKVPVKITFNSLYYLEEQYPILADIIQRLKEFGFETFIIADIGLILYLRKEKIDCKIHLSGECGQMNHLGMKFLNQLGISRYIFTRKDSIEDIRNCIAKNPLKPEYEAFVLNEYCAFSGAYCNSLHNDWVPQMCRVKYKIRMIHDKSEKMERINQRAIELQKELQSCGARKSTPNSTFGKTGCGVCKVLELKNAGVTHLKVVGRGKRKETLLDDMKQLREIINLTEQTMDTMEFEKSVKDTYFDGECRNYCYYSSR